VVAGKDIQKILYCHKLMSRDVKLNSLRMLFFSTTHSIGPSMELGTNEMISTNSVTIHFEFYINFFKKTLIEIKKNCRITKH